MNPLSLCVAGKVKGLLSSYVVPRSQYLHGRTSQVPTFGNVPTTP